LISLEIELGCDVLVFEQHALDNNLVGHSQIAVHSDHDVTQHLVAKSVAHQLTTVAVEACAIVRFRADGGMRWMHGVGFRGAQWV
jgi:hypothetical protein